MIEPPMHSLKVAFVADPKNIRRVFDPESGWEVSQFRGPVRASEGAIAAVPAKAERIGAKQYKFVRHNQWYYSFTAAVPQQPYPELTIVFDRNELWRLWNGKLLAKTKTLAPEIETFDDFLLLIREGVSALETLPPTTRRKLSNIVL